MGGSPKYRRAAVRPPDAQLFERIRETKEYYLIRTELGILRRHMNAIAPCVGPGALVIEPGSGSGIKTRMLLDGLKEPAGYVPIDVSKPQLTRFAAQIAREYPDLDVRPMCADFTSELELPACDADERTRTCYFPGSTIGNFIPSRAVDVLRRMAGLCADGGGVVIGVDLKKCRRMLESAYDDSEGISREFALNYLVRLNRELGADFRVDQFDYEAPYNDTLGRIEMALVSLRDQEVRFNGTRVRFRANERVRTEYSYKYTLAEFEALAGEAGLSVKDAWTDPDELFSIQYLEPL